VKRLFDLDIDEVSLVDRAANQHAVITFTKRADPEEDPMPGFYDSDGDLVDEVELDTGDVVYDEDGNEFVFLDDDTAEDLLEAGEIDESDLFAMDEPVEVGKASRWKASQGAIEYMAGQGSTNAKALQRRAARQAAAAAEKPGPDLATRARKYKYLKERGLAGPAGTAAPGLGRALSEGWAAGGSAQNAGRGTQLVRGAFGPNENRAFGAAAHVSRNRGKYAIGGGAGLVGAGYGVAQKSLGSEVYEELSKALTDSDRDAVISKAMDVVAQAREEAALANARVAELEARERMTEYVAKASQYDLPVDPEELAALLYEVNNSVSKSGQKLLGQILEQAASAGLYDEIGATGDYVDTQVMGMVSGFADQLVAKSDLSREQAVVALFETNPAAYDQYIAEQR
jgi:hypothetical protein